MQTNRIRNQDRVKPQPHPGRANSASGSTEAQQLILQVTIAKPSFKNASVRALSMLSPAEIRELVTCEEIITKGWATFVNVGRALAQIRDKRLYRADFDSFEAYCRQKWQYGKSHAYRLIGAAEVINHLSPIGDVPLPNSESQVRPLLGLKPEQVQTAWCQAVKKAGRKHVTARLVKETAAQFKSATDSGHTNGQAGPSIATVKATLLKAEELLQQASQSLENGDLTATVRLLGRLRTSLRPL